MASEAITAKALPEDVEAFLRGIVRSYIDGQRDELFAEWAATSATLLLECHGHLY